MSSDKLYINMNWKHIYVDDYAYTVASPRLPD